MKRPMLLGLSALATVLMAGTALAQPGIDDLEVTMTVAEPNAQSNGNQMDLMEEDSVNDLDDGQADDVAETDDADDGNVDDNQDGQDEDVEDGETDDGSADDVDDGDTDPADDGGI